MNWPVVAITGSGDEATAVAIRLFRAGFKIILVTQLKTVDLHFHRNFTRVIYAGQGKVEGVSALTFSQAFQQNLITEEQNLFDFMRFALNDRQIPVIFLEELKRGQTLPADYLVKISDSIYEKLKPFLNEKTRIIGFEKKQENDLWVSRETALWGQVQYPFLDEKEAAARAEKPRLQKVIETPLEGVFIATKDINERVREREEIAKINDIPILSPYNGVISGMINSGAMVARHTPIVEITTGRVEINARWLPTEAFALAGGVLEAIMFDWKNTLT
ncbi:hypothetical protein ACX8XN_16890 [Calditrichota bacterium GD2]